MPRRPDQNHYSHKVNILVLPVDENEVRNAPPSRQAEDKARAAREAKLMALAMQEKERRKNQDPCETARGPFRKTTETPRAPNKVNKLDLAALRRPIEDVMRASPRAAQRPRDVSMLLASAGGTSVGGTSVGGASVGGSRPPTACSRPPTAASSRPVTARSRPASTARPVTAASTRPGTARPGTGISVLQREITQELESNDATGAFRASLEHELERLEERKLAARQAAQAEVPAEVPAEQVEETPLPRDEPPSRCSSRRSQRSSTITSCSKGRVAEARAAQSTIEIA